MILTVRDLSFGYGKKTILSNISFSVDRGECLALAGSNGSGKSTLLSLIAGVRKSEKGTIEAQGAVGYVPQGTALFEDMSLKDNLMFFATLSGVKEKPPIPSELCGLENKRVSTLSGGQKKLLSVFCSLAGAPSLLLLDEPCNSLDIVWRDRLNALIAEKKKEGSAVIYAGHNHTEFYAFYDRLLVLRGNGDWSIYQKNELEKNRGEEGLSEALRNLIIK